MSALLEGFAAVRKCDDHGRTQMLKELESFAGEVSKLTALRPLPMFERVKAYVQAFFQKENVMEFIEQFHFQYDQHLLVALLNLAATKMSRKDKATALARIKEWKG